jgi:hypothetical protein
MMPMDEFNREEIEESKSGRSWSRLWIWLSLVLLFYGLSVGPAVRIHDRARNGSVRTAIEIFYTPLEMIQWTPLKRPLQIWIQWWRRGL